MSLVTLKSITNENWRESLGLSVKKEQQRFVASVTPPAAIALAKAYIRPGGMVVEPYAIYHWEQMVGYFNLHYIPNSKEDFWIYHFFIDQRFQQKGLGTSTFSVLINHLKENHPSCERIKLTVHPDNHAGMKFYKRLGFRDDHFLTDGQLNYSLSLRDYKAGN